MIRFRNFLPEDSRIVEIVSGLSILLMGVIIGSGNTNSLYYTALFTIQRSEFWATIFVIFGSVQLLSLFYYSRLDFLRWCMSLTCGCFLIWISLSTITWGIQLTDISTFMLGVGNLYGFVINSVLIGKTWEK